VGISVNWGRSTGNEVTVNKCACTVIVVNGDLVKSGKLFRTVTSCINSASLMSQAR